MITVTRTISVLLAIAVMATVGNSLQNGPPQPMRLQKFSRDLEWLREEKLIEVSFDILPLDKQNALLYGSLRDLGGTVGSLMLRSEDGGRNWAEVMAPVRGSGVWELAYTASGMLWALVVWQQESPADARLYKSEDKGKTWRWVTKLKKRYHDGWPENLRFFDDKHGLLEMYYGDQAGPENEGLWTLETNNGGRSWHEIRRITLAEYEEREKKEEERRDSSNIVRARDGSEWTLVPVGLEGDEPEQLQIRRRLPGEASWTTMRSMAYDFEVSGNELIERRLKQ